MSEEGRGNAAELNPLGVPTQLQTALQAQYGHHEKTFDLCESHCGAAMAFA